MLSGEIQKITHFKMDTRPNQGIRQNFYLAIPTHSAGRSPRKNPPPNSQKRDFDSKPEFELINKNLVMVSNSECLSEFPAG